MAVPKFEVLKLVKPARPSAKEVSSGNSEPLDYAQPPRTFQWERPLVLAAVALLVLIALAAGAIALAVEMGWTPAISITN